MAATQPTWNAENSRQLKTTGTVEQINYYMPDQPVGRDEIQLPDRIVHRFKDRHVAESIDFVRHTGVVDFITERRELLKKNPGRRPGVTLEAVAVAMHLAARDDKPLMMTTLRDILVDRLHPKSKNLLNVRLADRPPSDAPIEDRTRWEANTHAATRRAFHRLLDSINPAIMPVGTVRPWAEVKDLRINDLTDDDINERTVALEWVCNQFLETAYQQLPTKVRNRIEIADRAYCIDATPLPLWAKGRGKQNETASADHYGGFYIRTGDHRDPQEANPKAAPAKKKFWARDVHIVTLTDTSHPDRIYVPAGLPMSFNTDRPGMDPAGAARRIFANLHSRGHKPGTLAGDILYTNQNHEQYQTPAREAGYDLVLGYGKDQQGNQGAHEASGMKLVEGKWYGPCLPDDLAEATIQLREKRITLKEYGTKIRARAEFRMRTKENASPGRLERLVCPAAGPKPIAMCTEKEKAASMADRPTRQPDGTVADIRRLIDHTVVQTNGVSPTCCTSSAVAVTPADGAKFRQNHTYGSAEHYDLYTRSRQAQEGFNGIAKNPCETALDIRGRRRVMGWAANEIMTALLLAEAATRIIRSFLRRAYADKDGNLYTLRKKSLQRPKTASSDPASNVALVTLPPGAVHIPAPPDDDPDSDYEPEAITV